MIDGDKFELILTELHTMALHMASAPTDYNGVQLTREAANELLDQIMMLNKKYGQTLLTAIDALRIHR